MKRIRKLLTLITLFIITILGVHISTPLSAFASKSIKEPYDVALEIIEWKKNSNGTQEEYLINDSFLNNAGTTSGDWYPIGLGRLGIKDNQEGYLAIVNNNVQTRYQKSYKLDKAKATEWHRISLAVLASGGNPRRMGDNGDIDLIADGTYNRVDDKGNGILGKQGINGFIWGLIALDSLQYAIPEGAYYSRDDIILNLLNRQLEDGGWALSGKSSDPDITGMVLQALAPYYNSEKEYSFTINNSPKNKKVRTAINEALTWLSQIQEVDGGYSSWGTKNCESAVQVAVALCSLGVDIFTDKRFIKNDNTIYDNILSYQNDDGGFIHSTQYDSENPSSLPDVSNSMASEQTLYGMASIWRFQTNQRRLYDFKEEQSDELKHQIKSVEEMIEQVNKTTSISELQGVYNAYWAINPLERSYVKNYYKLSSLLQENNIPYHLEETEFNSGDAGMIVPMEVFTDLDIQKTNELPKTLTLEYKNEVIRLWTKILNSFDFEDKQTYYIKLEKAKNELESIEKEIESIKHEIKDKLYPFDNISISDKDIIYSIYERYMALSDYDKTLFDEADVEGLIKSKTQVDNLYNALLITLISSGIAIILSVFVVFSIRKRKKEKALLAMPESDE